MRDGYDEHPVNPLPPVVWLLVLPIVAMEIVLSVGSYGIAGGPDAIGWRADALQRFALSPLMLDQMPSAVCDASSSVSAENRWKNDVGSLNAVSLSRKKRSTYHRLMSSISAST